MSDWLINFLKENNIPLDEEMYSGKTYELAYLELIKASERNQERIKNTLTNIKAKDGDVKRMLRGPYRCISDNKLIIR